jgi:hypothetical protein
MAQRLKIISILDRPYFNPCNLFRVQTRTSHSYVDIGLYLIESVP